MESGRRERGGARVGKEGGREAVGGRAGKWRGDPYVPSQVTPSCANLKPASQEQVWSPLPEREQSDVQLLVIPSWH